MKLTNKFGLPDIYCQAVEIFEADYDRGKSDYTSTQLLRPVRIASLMKKHWKDLEEDVSDRLWALSGQAGHLIFQRVAERNPLRYIAEQRGYYNHPDGYVIGAKIDCYDLVQHTIWDYKETSVWKFIKGDTLEWEQQLNVNRRCFERSIGEQVGSLKILCKLKDWKLRQAGQKKDYPERPVHVVDLPIWDDKQVDDFISGRIKAFEAGRDNPPVCSPDERWERGGKWALMKTGRKTAVKLFDTMEDADGSVSDPKHYVEERPAEPTRCLYYCPVWMHCDFGLAAHEKDGAT